MWIKSLLEKPQLAYLFLFKSIKSNSNAADDHMMWLETEIKMIFNYENDVEFIHRFTAKDKATTSDVTMGQQGSYKYFINKSFYNKLNNLQ